MIPKRIHYIWVGGKPLPEPAAKLIETWRVNNPGYEVQCWDEKNIDFTSPYIRRAYRAKNWANVSNLVRLLVLYNHGGIYLDTDIEVRRSFDPLLNCRVFCGFQTEHPGTHWANNAVLGAEPGHPFLITAAEHLVDRWDGLEQADHSGPETLTDVLRDLGLEKYSNDGALIGDVFVAPCRYFYPYGWDETFIETCVTPDTYTIHYWEKSWARIVTQRGIAVKIMHRLERAAPRFFRVLGRLNYPQTPDVQKRQKPPPIS